MLPPNMAKTPFYAAAPDPATGLRDDFTDPIIDADRICGIVRKYSGKYEITSEGGPVVRGKEVPKVVARVNGKKVNVDYLPSLDLMLDAQKTYENPLEVVGAAIFKMDNDKILFLVDDDDPRLQAVYERNRADADKLASELWRLHTQEFNYQFTEYIPLATTFSFALAFGRSYEAWRRSLADGPTGTQGEK
jgi:hypothetical protein